MSELIRATSTRSWSLSRPLSERVADAEEVKPARSACTTELCAWLRQRTLLRLRRIALRLGGAQSGSGDVIVRRQQFIQYGPSVDFEEQRGFRQDAQATELIDYFSANLDR